MSTEDKSHPQSPPKLNSGEYLPLRVMGFPKDPAELLTVPLHGSRTESTTAYLFNYPFDIVVSGKLSDVNDLARDGKRITVYAPYRSQTDERRMVENLPLDNVPYRSGANAPNFPSFLAPTLTIPQTDPTWRADSLRVDCLKGEPYEVAANVADSIIGLIRCFTGQWWIKRGRQHSRTHIRHWFNANEVGERLGGIGVFAFLYGKMGCERPLDSIVWHDVIDAFAHGHRISLSLDIFLDSIFFHSADDLRRSVLELGISNEVLLAETLSKWVSKARITQSQSERLLRGSDFLNHLGNLEALCKRSFAKDNPSAFAWIKSTWIGRGHVAHGKAPRAPVPDGSQELTLKSMPSAFLAAQNFREWLNEL
jgi:hypothetical protein